MDPDAALRNFIEACANGEVDEALDAIEALYNWMNNGGFPPTSTAIDILRAMEGQPRRQWG